MTSLRHDVKVLCMTSKRATYGAGSAEQVGPDRWRLRWSEGADPFTGKHRRRTETITATSAKEARRELAARTSARQRLTLGHLVDEALEKASDQDRARLTRYIGSFLTSVNG